jgi:hypothetical protein
MMITSEGLIQKPDGKGSLIVTENLVVKELCICI